MGVMTEEEFELAVAEMKDHIEDELDGKDMFLCLCALTEKIVELLYEMDDHSPKGYDPFKEFAEMFKDAKDSAVKVSSNYH